MGSEAWISVLKLSTMWAFGKLRQKAIKRLGKLNVDPVEKVMLARNYKVEQFLVDGYGGLITRKEGPSLEEAKVLGYEVVIQLYKMREQHSRLEGMPPSSMRRSARTRMVSDIEKTFKEELDNIKRDSRAICDVHGIENNEPGGSMSDSDSDRESSLISSSRKRARRQESGI